MFTKMRKTEQRFWLAFTILIILIFCGVFANYFLISEHSGGAGQFLLQKNVASDAIFYGEADDEIVQVDEAGAKKTIFRASKIREFEVLKNRELVVVVGENSSSKLKKIDIKTKRVTEIPVENASSIMRLRVAGSGEKFGYIAKDRSSKKWNLLIENWPQNGETQIINELTGSPEQIENWFFVNDSAVVVRSYDGEMLAIEISGENRILPLGRSDSMLKISDDGEWFFYERSGKNYKLNLISKNATEIK